MKTWKAPHRSEAYLQDGPGNPRFREGYSGLFRIYKPSDHRTSRTSRANINGLKKITIASEKAAIDLMIAKLCETDE